MFIWCADKSTHTPWRPTGTLCYIGLFVSFSFLGSLSLSVYLSIFLFLLLLLLLLLVLLGEVMMEAGDDVGPFVARLRDERGGRGGAEGESLKNTNASPHSLQSSSSSFSSLLRSFQIGRGRKVFAEDHAQILHQSSSSSSPRLFLRSLPVRAKPVIAGR